MLALREADARGSPRRPISGYVDPDFPNPNGEWDTPIIIYGYTPIFALAVFSAVWFFVLALAHVAVTVKTKTWWWLPGPIGLVFEVIGYIARSLSARKDPYHLIYFILNYFFIVTAPVFLAAGIYTVLSVLIKRLGRSYSFLSPRFILIFFITSDAIATVLQVAGAALIGKAESDRKDPTTANNILLGGLAYQVFPIGIFIILAAIFIYRTRRVIQARGLVVFTAAFATGTLLIYLRTIFRLAETAKGLLSNLQTNEVYFACLEFAPIALAMLLFAVWHPGQHIRNLSVSPGTDPRAVEEK